MNTLIQKLESKLKLLYCYKHILNANLKIMLCGLLILFNFNYCGIVYNSCLSMHNMKIIQMVQHSCLRFIYGIGRRQHISHMIKSTGWLCMRERRIFYAFCVYHKIFVTKLPQFLHNKIQCSTDVINISLRLRDILDTHRHNFELYKR